MENSLQKFHDRNFILFFSAFFLLSLPPPIILSYFVDAPDLKNNQLSILGDLFPLFVILLIPTVETLAFQALPSVIFDFYTFRPYVKYFIISFPFAIGHVVPELMIPSLINGAVGGIVLGIFYLSCRHKSHSHAIAATIAIHAAHNAAAMAFCG